MKPIRTLATILVAAASVCLAAASARASADAEASKYIETVGTHALSVITSNGSSKQQKQAQLQKIFADNVDFQWVGRFVLGRHWRQATESQKHRYLAEYQKFLLLHYTARFTDYTSGSFRVTSSRDDGDNEFTVSTQMQSTEISNNEPVMVDYRVRKGESGFKIFDVIVEGVSLLTTQRSEFSSVINNKGLDYLINQLATKAASDVRPSAGKKHSRRQAEPVTVVAVE